MRNILYCVLACLVLFSAGDLLAQTQTGSIRVVGVSDRFKATNGGQSTYGVNVVGVNARIVLKAFAWSGTGRKYTDTVVAVTSATWTVTPPSGSAPVVADTGTGTGGKVVYFVPTVQGEYTVDANIVSVTGQNLTGTIKVWAGVFRGLGSYNPATQSWDNGFCEACHDLNSGVFASFKKTNHATVFPRRVNDPAGHFGKNCLPCHTTGYNTAASNGGYDDISTANSKYDTLWLDPAYHNNPGVYDSMLVKAPAVMPFTGIQCETCHGPAGEHTKRPSIVPYTASMSSEVCAPCHFSSDRHPKGYAWDVSGHAKAMQESEAQLEYLSRPSCNRCHTGTGYVDQIIKGNPEPVVPSGEKAYQNPVGVTCQACHDPHSNANPYQLRVKNIADACVDCHQTRASSRGLHHSPQGSLLIGADATPMTQAIYSSSSTVIGLYSGWEFPGYQYANGAHSEIQNRCAECHMAKTPLDAYTYDAFPATVDTLINKLGGHTFRVRYENIINDTGCKGCHSEGAIEPVTLEYVEGSQNTTKTLLNQLAALLPKRDTLKTEYVGGTPITPGDTVTWQTNNRPSGSTRRKLTTVEKAAAYNWYLVAYDGSFGVHNPGYARQLLQSSIEQMQLGTGAAEIASVKDVPNDQGRRVQVVWNMFPAENLAYNNVINYGVWRQDPQIGTKITATPKKNYTEMIKSGVVGEKYAVNGMVWTYVAQVPATKLSLYSYITETLADSTGAGAASTAFYIAGYSLNNAVVYSSQPFNGYSVDNIAPFKVTSFTVAVGASGAVLNWKPVDQDDVAEFLVFRGTTPDFTPTTPLATVKGMSYTDAGVTAGQLYYYLVQGVDKSGNRGEISSPMGTTGVEVTDGVPTDYALGQNFPNPFNPTTVIPFSLPNSGHVVLKVYTISGEEIATLVDREMSSGNYNFTWDGRDKAGRTVATGMYLYRMQSGSFSSVKKMVLVK